MRAMNYFTVNKLETYLAECQCTYDFDILGDISEVVLLIFLFHYNFFEVDGL